MGRTATDETQEALASYIGRALKFMTDETGVLRGVSSGSGSVLFTWTSSTARQLHGTGIRWWSMQNLSFDVSMACAALAMVHIDLARAQLSQRATQDKGKQQQQLWLQRSSDAPAQATERFTHTKYNTEHVVDASKRLRECAGVLDFMALHGWPAHREHGKRQAPPDVAGEVVLGMRDMVLAAAQGCAAFKAASGKRSIGAIARLIAGMAQWFYKAYLRMGGVALDSGEGGLLVHLPLWCKPGELSGVEPDAAPGAAGSDSDEDVLSPAGMYSEVWDAGWVWPLVKGPCAPPVSPADAAVTASKPTVLQNINPSIRSHCATSACLCRSLAHKFHTLHLRSVLAAGQLPPQDLCSTAADTAAHAREAERWMCKSLHMYGERDDADSTHPLVGELQGIREMRAAAEEDCLQVYSVMPAQVPPPVQPAFIMKMIDTSWQPPTGDTQWLKPKPAAAAAAAAGDATFADGGDNHDDGGDAATAADGGDEQDTLTATGQIDAHDASFAAKSDSDCQSGTDVSVAAGGAEESGDDDVVVGDRAGAFALWKPPPDSQLPCAGVPEENVQPSAKRRAVPSSTDVPSAVPAPAQSEQHNFQPSAEEGSLQPSMEGGEGGGSQARVMFGVGDLHSSQATEPASPTVSRKRPRSASVEAPDSTATPAVPSSGLGAAAEQ